MFSLLCYLTGRSSSKGLCIFTHQDSRGHPGCWVPESSHQVSIACAESPGLGRPVSCQDVQRPGPFQGKPALATQVPMQSQLCHSQLSFLVCEMDLVREWELDFFAAVTLFLPFMQGPTSQLGPPPIFLPGTFSSQYPQYSLPSPPLSLCSYVTLSETPTQAILQKSLPPQHLYFFLWIFLYSIYQLLILVYFFVCCHQ